MIKVNKYVKSDGTKVRSHKRSEPEFPELKKIDTSKLDFSYEEVANEREENIKKLQSNLKDVGNWKYVKKGMDVYYINKDNSDYYLTIVKVGNSSKYSVSVVKDRTQIHQKEYTSFDMAYVDATYYMSENGNSKKSDYPYIIINKSQDRVTGKLSTLEKGHQARLMESLNNPNDIIMLYNEDTKQFIDWRKEDLAKFEELKYDDDKREDYFLKLAGGKKI